MGAVYREELSANARKLIEQLLSLPQGWVTAAALAESIGVSRRTVLRELPAVEQWMQAAGGCFFLPEGGVSLLRSSMPEKELAEVLCGRMPENEIFSTLLDTKKAEKVWAVLQQFEQEEQLHLPDAGFLALAIHCTLTIQQLRQGGDKGSAPQRAAPGGQSCCPAGGGAEPRLRADPAA